MKFFAVVVVFLLVIACQSEQTVTIELPYKLVEGYGPFKPGFSPLSDERNDGNSWSKTYKPVVGIPKNWRNVKKTMVWLNARQFTYQNAMVGNITAAHYKQAQSDWHWTPDETKLSKTPIKCFTYVIRGIDKKGEWVVMVDTDCDLDFSDEEAFYPEIMNPDGSSFDYKKSQIITYELYQHGKVVSVRSPIVIKKMGDIFLYNFPQYAKATLSIDGKLHEISVVPDGFLDLEFTNAQLIETTMLDSKKQVNMSELAGFNEIVRVGGLLGKKYKNKGIDLYTGVLRLEGVAADTTIYSKQVGYFWEPFQGTEFSTGKPFSLTDLKGKYVYLDFWGTWCRGCVEDIPELKLMYEGLDKNKFEFVGIVEDSPEKLRTFINKNALKWPQILSDSTNKLIEKYHISGFPSTFLLDPAGKVIARDLKGNDLKKKLAELSKK
jgi:peroxiredoxin